VSQAGYGPGADAVKIYIKVSAEYKIGISCGKLYVVSNRYIKVGIEKNLKSKLYGTKR